MPAASWWRASPAPGGAMPSCRCRRRGCSTLRVSRAPRGLWSSAGLDSPVLQNRQPSHPTKVSEAKGLEDDPFNPGLKKLKPH
ncbi:unnamed protein product [Symbiodinium natans]|uniref:Uncharacterized protein n=1 Tax=Symbiodinium natans TaxID=878477 RepID=A0A812S0V6_9DINO|nr:unnamed protein product [Symbiodinium natans]